MQEAKKIHWLILEASEQSSNTIWDTKIPQQFKYDNNRSSMFNPQTKLMGYYCNLHENIPKNSLQTLQLSNCYKPSNKIPISYNIIIITSVTNKSRISNDNQMGCYDIWSWNMHDCMMQTIIIWQQECVCVKVKW